MSGAILDGERECTKCDTPGQPGIYRVLWDRCAGCGKIPGGWYCEPHRKWGAGIGAWTHGGCGHIITGYRSLSLRESAIERFAETGYIEDKNAILDLVTLTEPKGWDIYGSILKPLPAAVRQPRRRRVITTPLRIIAAATVVAWTVNILLLTKVI